MTILGWTRILQISHLLADYLTDRDNLICSWYKFISSTLIWLDQVSCATVYLKFLYIVLKNWVIWYNRSKIPSKNKTYCRGRHNWFHDKLKILHFYHSAMKEKMQICNTVFIISGSNICSALFYKRMRSDRDQDEIRAFRRNNPALTTGCLGLSHRRGCLVRVAQDSK